MRRFVTAVASACAAAGALAHSALAGPPVMERSNPQEWTVHVDLFVQSYPIRDQRSNARFRTTFELRSALVVFPLIEESASHETNLANLKSGLTLQDDENPIDESAEILTGYQSDERLGRWDFPAPLEISSWRLLVDIPMTLYETKFNEDAALALDWPQDQWPELARTALEPQLFVESNDERVQALVEKWTRGRPQSVKPALLAKALAAEVIKSFQPTGQGVESDRLGRYQGMKVAGAAAAAKRGRGSPYDMAALLCAVYRAAGLPARVVIGLDLPNTLGHAGQIVNTDPDCVSESGGAGSVVPVLHAWVEFALYDEQSDRLWWTPVDVVRQRKNSNRPPALDQPWKYFGNHACLENIAPLSFHFHPPTAVVNAGPPALWGWRPEPRVPAGEQVLSFDAWHTVKRGGD